MIQYVTYIYFRFVRCFCFPFCLDCIKCVVAGRQEYFVFNNIHVSLFVEDIFCLLLKNFFCV